MKTRTSSRHGKSSSYTSPNMSDPATELDFVSEGAKVEDRDDKNDQHKTKIGNVGYTFRKYFHAGWFNGKVVEIRLGAANGKDRRCLYEDGDLEDLSVAELKALAIKASKCPTSKMATHPRVEPKEPFPEKVVSSIIGYADAFDENDYRELYRRYLTPRVRESVEIPSGMTLRRQFRNRMIDNPTPGFKKLKRRIDFLLKMDERHEVYKILCQLRNWEINPLRNEVFRDANEYDQDAAKEYADLTKEGDDEQCIDVERYILDLALVDGKQHRDCDENMETIADSQSLSCSYVQPMRVVVKQEDNEEGFDGKSTKQKEKCTTFQPAALEPERCSEADQRGQSTLCSRTLNCALVETDGVHSEFLHDTAPSNRADTQIFAPIRITKTAKRCVEKYITQEVKSIFLAVQQVHSNRVDVPNEAVVQVVTMGQVDQGSGVIIEENAFHSCVFSLRNISEKVHDQYTRIDEYNQKLLGLDTSRIHSQRMNPPMATLKVSITNMRRRRMLSLGKLPPLAPQSGTFCRGTKLFPQSMSRSTCARTFSTRTAANAYPLPPAALSKLYRWDFGPYILALQRRESVMNKVANISLPQQSEVSSLVPSYRTRRIDKQDLSQRNLADGWREQNKRRRKGVWMPQGRSTGRWKAPKWVDGTPPTERKPATCKKVFLPVLKGLLKEFISSSPSPSSDIDAHRLSSIAHLKDLICPFYLKPTPVVLKRAHHAIQSLLPEGDCESFDVIEVARKYYDYWRPAHGKTKVILLAESHAFTKKEYVIDGPRLDDSILTTKRYGGPREFLSLVYCLAYGENEALTSNSVPNNKGTPQFWSLLAACSRGIDHMAKVSASSKQQTSPQFASDILKGGGLPLEERLNAKLKILEDLRERGVWLLDVSIFGWYISQPQQYKKSAISNEIHRMTKQRPPPYMKAPSLVLSYELFTKHLLREIAEEGDLQLIIPIGREVEQTITHKRLVDAVRIPGSMKPHARVLNAFPAPNAWIPGGYGPFYARLADLVTSAAPPKVNNIDDIYQTT